MDLSGLVPVPATPTNPDWSGSTVYLLPALGLEGGAMAEFDLLSTQSIEDEDRRTFAMLARWTATFVRYGSVAWDWTRQNGEAVPFDPEVLVSDYSVSRLIAEKANQLYSEAVMRPLFETAAARAKDEQAKANRAQRRSATGQTASSTSPRPAATRRRPASSSPADTAGPPLRIAQ